MLNTMWNKIQTTNKWGYSESISHSDYPYKLNNSNEVGGVYNRTVNTKLGIPTIEEKNLDYFYRIGEFYGKDNLPIKSDLGIVNNWTVVNFIGDESEIHTSNVTVTDSSITISLTPEKPYIGLKINDIKLEINKEYFVSYKLDLSLGSIINNTITNEITNIEEILGFKVGMSEELFDNQYIDYQTTGEINVSFISRAKIDYVKFVF